MGFKQWLEDTGQVFSRTNDTSDYTTNSVGSKIVSTDKKKRTNKRNIDKLFGRNNKYKKRK